MEGEYSNKKRFIMKQIRLLILVLFLGGLLAGCQKDNDYTKKVRDIDYTVLDETKIPKDLKKVINEKREVGFKLSYVEGEYLYIAIGFGEKDTGGYSVSVNQLYQTKNGVYFDTTLQGPDGNDVISQTHSYPYLHIVLLMPHHPMPVL